MFSLSAFMRQMAHRPALTLLLEHMAGYAELAGVELASWRARLCRSAAWGVIAVVLGVMALGSTVSAAMLLAVWHLQQMSAPWLLGAVPSALVLACGLSAWLAIRPWAGDRPSDLRQQLATDWGLLRPPQAMSGPLGDPGPDATTNAGSAPVSSPSSDRHER
jgi:uncharacterized membrane protein YqjE